MTKIDLPFFFASKLFISSVESQKGAITIQRCSIENQKGAIGINIVGYNDYTLLVFNETSLNIDSALLALNLRYYVLSFTHIPWYGALNPGPTW